MTGRDLFRARSAADEWESLEIFITSYYDSGRLPPLKIYLQEISHGEYKEHFELLLGWFKKKFSYEPELLTVSEKHHAAILAMARQNAVEDLRKRLKERGAGPALDELARLLNLETKPERIEGRICHRLAL